MRNAKKVTDKLGTFEEQNGIGQYGSLNEMAEMESGRMVEIKRTKVGGEHYQETD
jgi:hypothetical protein